MNYAKITKHDIANGRGVRVVLWVSGCSHHCTGCQNPDTWDDDYGSRFEASDLSDIITLLREDWISGLTLSGGDPLKPSNVDICTIVAACVKSNVPNKDIWCWTGYTWDEIIAREDCNDILQYIDVLVDGEFIQDKYDISLKWRGSSNQRVIDVKKSLQAGKVVLYCD